MKHLMGKAHTDLTAPLVSHCTMIDKCAKKFGINAQLRDKLFLIVMHRFILVKAAMNEPNIFNMC